MRLEVTGKEYDSRRLDDSTLQAALEAISRHGYVVLGGAVDPAVLDTMKPKLGMDTEEMRRRAERGEAGPLPGHLSQPMPRSGEHIYGDVVANPLLIQVTAAILGEGVHMHFYNGNTNMPGSPVQFLHRDAPHLWPDPVHPVTSLVVNIAPVDVDESNGATELWPGTHHIVGLTGVTSEAEEERRVVAPPVRAVTRKGDAVIRDPRLWHRGMPNHTAEPRHMVAMVHSKWFYERDTAIRVTRSALHAFDDDILTTRLELVPDDFDYLSEDL